MKYHYQCVSPRSVRIELIPEDQKESTFLKSLDDNSKNQHLLNELFLQPLSAYATGTAISKINFIHFPKVALVSFEKITLDEKSCA